MSLLTKRILLAVVSLAIVCLPLPANADIIVDVQDASVSVGGSGTIDVLISSTGTDDFDFASYVFGITNVGAPTGVLTFSDPQSTTESGAANYIFAADLAIGGLDFIVNDPSEVEGTDFTDSGGPITLGTTARLLAQLDVDLSLGATIGDQFRITLLPTSNFGGSDTEFVDGATARTITADSFDQLGIRSGLITASEAAAVPEPGSMALLLAGLATVPWMRRRTRGGFPS